VADEGSSAAVQGRSAHIDVEIGFHAGGQGDPAAHDGEVGDELGEAGALEPSAYEEFGWRYILEITEFLKAKFPHIPLIVFAKGTGAQMSRLSRIAEQRGEASFDVWGVDWSTPIELAREQLGGKFVLQGNLEPMRLYDRGAIESGVREILAAMKGVAHIFNLGHGILPDVSVQNAKYLVDLVHELSAR